MLTLMQSNRRAHSRRVAEEMYNWLPQVSQAIEPWLPSEDIGKGTRWSSHITTELAASKAGIFYVTPGNHNAPCLNFETGAISKGFIHQWSAPCSSG